MQNRNGGFRQPAGGWDRHWDRIWHGRHYHWNNGAWAILNDGFYPYDDSYYLAPDADAAPDMSYEYDNSAPSAPTRSEAEQSIAADVQQSLEARGYYHGEIDGFVGDTTRGAIADFQKDNDLPITGYITKSLLGALGL